MSVRDIRSAALGATSATPAEQVSVAAALRAVDAAMAALESARLTMLAIGRATIPPPPDPPAGDGCAHPLGARICVSTMGAQSWLCQACGESVDA